MGGNLQRFKFDSTSAVYDAINFNDCQVYLVTNKAQAEDAISCLKKHKTLYVACENTDHSMSKKIGFGIIQIATSSTECYIFDLISFESMHLLADIFKDDTIQKVFHDCSNAVTGLYKMNIDVERLEDTQVAHKVYEASDGDYNSETLGLPLYRLYKKLFGKDYPNIFEHPKASESDSPKNKPTEYETMISERPLSETAVKYAAAQVLLLQDVFENEMRLIPALRKPDYRLRVPERQTNLRELVKSDSRKISEQTILTPEY